MSVNYAAELSYYPNKGVCGLPEVRSIPVRPSSKSSQLFDSASSVEASIVDLASKMARSNHCVVHTGAGISTAAGIPDFRGPRGVWTLEERGEAPVVDITFEEARPTFTHRSLVALHRRGYIKLNIDGLHMRSGLPSTALAELHGNMFVETCDTCKRDYVRSTVVTTIGQKFTGNKCDSVKSSGRTCRGRLRDSVLDWEHDLPDKHITLAEEHSRKADICLTLGTSLRIEPANQLPFYALKNGGSCTIVNLQKTKMDRRASSIIRARVDDVMRRLCELLDVEVDDEGQDYEEKTVRRPGLPTIDGHGDDVAKKEGEEEPLANTPRLS